MSNSSYYGGSGGGKYASIPEEHEMFSPDLSSPPAHKRSDSQDTLVGGPFSPDMRGPGRRGFFSSAPDLDPGFRLQTRMASMSPGEKKALSSLYSSRLQMRKNFSHMIARFAFTTACCAAIVGLFKYYGSSGVLDNDNKYIFNAIYIGISMILSMNLIVSPFFEKNVKGFEAKLNANSGLIVSLQIFSQHDKMEVAGCA